MTNKDTLKKLMEQAQEVLDIDMDGRTREHVAMQFSSDVLPDTERNLVFFGAPGTGKSFKMNKDCDEIISSYGGEYERVTFHPEYTYSQFVGVYKPTTDSDGNIKYEFVPGPFMRIYVKAIRSILTNSPQPYFLLIEEMNRARVSAVFGDIFQLLDRSGDWSSEYDVQASEDIKKFLADELGCFEKDITSIRIPSNMFIWATMNTADQGVYPMDTAFKRRWSFEYIDVDAQESKISGALVTINGVDYSWNKVRKAINKKLLDVCNANEDKLLGTFFIARKLLEEKSDMDHHVVSNEALLKAIENKVIMYLFEDAAKSYRSKFFNVSTPNSYSAICKKFRDSGLSVFGSTFVADYYETL